ncbi:MAG: hypothetical protein ACRDZR_02405 [Acidimicrobiales bacterium]
MRARYLVAGAAASLMVTFVAATAGVTSAGAASSGLPTSPAQVRQAMAAAGLPTGTGGSGIGSSLGRSSGGHGPAVITPSQWSELQTPTFGTGQTQVLAGVSCASPTGCVAVGASESSTGTQAIAAVLVGSHWTATAVPLPAGVPDSELLSVSCASASFCIAVGARSTTPVVVTTVAGPTNATSLIERWNGTAWSVVTSPTHGEAFLSSVSCPTTSFCTAVGTYFTTAATSVGTVVDRWNGGTWSTSDVPSPATTLTLAEGVSCTSATFCMAGGTRLSVSLTGTTTLVLTFRMFTMSWNGTSWSTVPTPAPGATSLQVGYGVSCANPSVCTAVGYQANVTSTTGIVLSGLIEQWNGSAWTVAATPGSRPAVLLGVDCFGPTSCVATGTQESSTATLAALPLVETWNGATWTVAGLPSVAAATTTFATQALYGASCVAGARCVAVGENSPTTLSLTSPVPRTGYTEVASDGGLFAFGTTFYGSMGGKPLNKPVVGMAMSPDGGGYWEVASDGGLFAFGDAQFYGSMGGQPLNEPVVGMSATQSGRGYWEVASDGGLFAFGDAQFYGSMGGKPLNEPVVGLAATPDGGGYWEVASDGGLFAFGDAPFYGSMGGKPLNKPIVGLAATPDGGGYWEVASDGGLFAFGDATFYGSMGGKPLNEPVVGLAATADGTGYWEVASDGGIFAFGDAPFYGSMGGKPLNEPIVGIAQ